MFMKMLFLTYHQQVFAQLLLKNKEILFFFIFLNFRWNCYIMATIDNAGHDKHCCVPFCNGNGRLHKELSFHKIPNRPDIRKAWVQAIRRDPGPNFSASLSFNFL